MGYSDQKYLARPLQLVIDGQLGTGTASAAGVAGNLKGLPTFVRKTKISNVVVVCDVVSKVTTTHFVLLNGTSTLADETIGTYTAGQIGTLSLSATAALSTFAAAAGPTYKGTGTFTASGDTVGSFQVYFEANELPA